VFGNRVLRKTFGSKRDEVEVKWRRLHNEELHNVYASSNIIRSMKGIKYFGWKTRRKRPFGRPRC
jgi:hypothetical protein